VQSSGHLIENLVPTSPSNNYNLALVLQSIISGLTASENVIALAVAANAID